MIRVNGFKDKKRQKNNLQKKVFAQTFHILRIQDTIAGTAKINED